MPAPVPNSSTGGYLTPQGAALLEDDALDDFLHDVVAGITGLDNTLVRPRWQPEPPDPPARNVNWCAFGVMRRLPFKGQADIIHNPAGNGGDGSDIMTRHEELQLLVSFYGPNCQGIGGLLRDGIQLSQNREQLFLAGFGLMSVGDDLTKSPELVKNQWLQRADLPLYLRREVRREYPVMNLLKAQATLVAPPITRTILTPDIP